MFLNLVAPVNSLGYGVTGFNVLKSLVEAGHNVSYFPIGQPQWGSKPKDNFIEKCFNNSKTFNPDAPSIRIWHQNDLAMFPGGGERIGWPIFELNKLTMVEAHHLMSVDRLFVCSQWAKDVLLAELGKDAPPIDVVPLGVDPDVFYVDEKAQREREYWTQKKTVFINAGKWEVRKGHRELLEAFCKAFKPDDPVELWMLNENPFIGPENENWKTQYIASPMGGSIKILPRVNTQDKLRQWFNKVDFGVFPAHAEGWNLEILELMACGVPSIVTNYSGHTEFCNEANSFLVEPNGMETAQDGKWFHGQGEWCTFEVDDLVDAMLAAHDAKQSGKNERREACLETAQRLTWTNTVRTIEEVL